MAFQTYSSFMLAVMIAPSLAVYSQSTAAIPLWPCYSVHRLPNNTDPFEFRYVGVTDCDCVFTLEGPAGSTLSLQLHDVYIESPKPPPYGYGYGYNYNNGYGGGYMDCSQGTVKVFNFATSGTLNVADTVCSFMTNSQKVTTDTNMAVITSTIHRGQFYLTVTINPENITELIPPELIGTTTTMTPGTSSTTAGVTAILANLIADTQPPPTTTAASTTTTRRTIALPTRRTVSNRRSTTRRPVVVKNMRPTTESTTITTTTEATATRSPARPTTMMVQAELLVQENEDLMPTWDLPEETEEPEYDISTTESTTEDIESNLIF